MDSKAKVVFILNPHSGTQSKTSIPDIIKSRLDTAQFDYEVCFTEHAGHAVELTRKCVAEAVDIVVAVGGDGTVNEVARSLVHSNTALGIIPCPPFAHTYRCGQGHRFDKPLQH